ESVREPLQQTMTHGAGVLRSGASLASTAVELVRLGQGRAAARTASWEATNLLMVACALVGAATRREETRGCHWREDFPDGRDAWLGHLLARVDEEGGSSLALVTHG